MPIYETPEGGLRSTPPSPMEISRLARADLQRSYITPESLSDADLSLRRFKARVRGQAIVRDLAHLGPDPGFKRLDVLSAANEPPTTATEGSPDAT